MLMTTQNNIGVGGRVAAPRLTWKDITWHLKIYAKYAIRLDIGMHKHVKQLSSIRNSMKLVTEKQIRLCCSGCGHYHLIFIYSRKWGGLSRNPIDVFVGLDAMRVFSHAIMLNA